MRINDHSYANTTGTLHWIFQERGWSSRYRENIATQPRDLKRRQHKARRRLDRELIEFELAWRLDYFDGHLVRYSPYYFVYRPETLKYL